MVNTWSATTATTEFTNIASDTLDRYDLNGGKSSERRIDVVDVVQHIWRELYDFGNRKGIKDLWQYRPPRWLQKFARRHACKYIEKEIVYRRYVRLHSDRG